MKRFLLIAIAFTSLASTALAQISRSTLTGHVSDSTGATIPNAQITITDTDTGGVTKAKSNGAGDYTVPYLEPGHYKVTVTANGFKQYSHDGLTLETEQTVTENVKLSVGDVQETVTVEGAAPMVDTADSNTGQTLTAEEVEDLPSNGRSPIGFAHMEYGAVAKGKHSESQVTPFGNSTGSDFSLGGGNSASNEVLMNGVPNMEDGGRTSGFSPLLEAVDAVRVDEFSANAAYGDTAGGIVNITTKAGTNAVHGSLSEYYNGSRPFSAKPYFTAPGATVSSTHFNQYGASIGGPVVLPWLFNGHDKLFFFYAFEGYVGSAPATTITSVPTAAERTGDFSALLAYNSADQLYNPYTAVTTGSVVTRSKIPNNCLVATCGTTAGAGLTLSPIALAYLNYMPLPNYNGASTKPDGENNFFASDPTLNNYKSHQGRLDYVISNSNKIFVEGHRSRYVNSQSNIFNNLLTGTNSTVILAGGQVDDVQNFNPTTALELRFGFSRYTTYSEPGSVGTNPSSVGFPGYIGSNSTQLALPYLTFSDSTAIPSLSGNPGNQERFDNFQLYSSLNKTWGHHTIKIGPDFRASKNSSLSPGAADGTFTFKSATGDYVTGGSTSPNSAVQQFGGAFAMFMLGTPTSGSYAINTKFQYNNWYWGGFVQDDWKVLPNFTISLGLRLEAETPVVESHNQMQVGWNPTGVNAVTSGAETAYTASPSPYLAASAFQPTGTLIYGSPSRRGAYNTAPLYASPRFGFAWSPDFSHGTLAVRGGIGVYVNPFGDYDAGNSYGYSQTTSMITATNNSSVLATLSDPFDPVSNPIELPYANSLGVNTQLGAALSYYGPVKVPYSEKWTFDIQKQFVKNWMVEVGYLGVHQIHNSYGNQLSYTPVLPYLSTSPYGNSAQTAAAQKLLTTTVANPFKGLLPSTYSTLTYNTNSTLTTSQILQAYPEYTSVTQNLVPGESSNFNAFLMKFTKRMSYGLQFTFNYEWSRQLGATSQLNTGGPLWYGETSSDFPQHASVMTIYQLPFGRGRQFMNHSRLWDEVAGGWNVTGIYQFLSGTPIGWGNAIYTGNWSGFHNNAHYTLGPSFNTAGFDTTTADQPGTYNYRTFPADLLRSDPTNNFDFSIMKNFTLYDRIVFQPRVDAFNALNRAQFSSANVSPTSASFGDITSQLNSGRSLQGGLHIYF